MIKYKKRSTNIDVYPNNNKIGVIQVVKDDYTFFTKGTEEHGEICNSIQKVKDNLEKDIKNV